MWMLKCGKKANVKENKNERTNVQINNDANCADQRFNMSIH